VIGKSFIEGSPRPFDKASAALALSKTLFRLISTKSTQIDHRSSAFTAPRTTAKPQINFMKNMTKSTANI
jgi:hypothetical protein